MSKAFVSTIRASLVSAAVGLAFCVLLGRLFYLHVWERDRFLEHVRDNRQMLEVVEAQRGNVVDARGNLMATTHTTIDLGVDPQEVQAEDLGKLPALAHLTGQPVERLRAAFERRTQRAAPNSPEVRLVRWAFLAKGLDEATYDAVMDLGIAGVYGNRKYTRTYPGGRLAAHVVGYLNRESVPVMGVERFFDYYLRGQDGWRESERDGRRRELARFREREIEPSDGLNLELTLDQTVQHIVERTIDDIVAAYAPESVSVIVSRVSTGAVLALANYPTFDPNEFNDLEKYPLAHQRNRALTDRIEPGSTFKIVPAAAVLNEGIVDPGDPIRTGASRVSYRGRELRLPGDHREYASLSMREVVVKSSNRGAAHLGLRLGERRLHDYAAAFGFGERTGIDLAGEVSGTLHPVSRWDSLTITRMPMGHAVNATPLQIHSAMATVANKGVLMEPLIATRVFDAEGKDVVRFSPKAKRRVIDTEVAELLTRMLVEVVGEAGTARRAAIENYAVAGKTGTTQKIVDGEYSNRHHVASFSGFFPADKPGLAITVVVNEPQLQGIGYGGRVAAPAFKSIAEACIGYLGIRPSRINDSFIALEPSVYDRSRRLSN